MLDHLFYFCVDNLRRICKLTNWLGLQVRVKVHMTQKNVLLFLVVGYLSKMTSMFKVLKIFKKEVFTFKIPASLASNVSWGLRFVMSLHVPLMSHRVLPRELLVVILVAENRKCSAIQVIHLAVTLLKV